MNEFKFKKEGTFTWYLGMLFLAFAAGLMLEYPEYLKIKAAIEAVVAKKPLE
jgi:hypothetical protein